MPLRKKSLPKAFIASYLALIVANIIWGAAGPVIKLTISFLPPFTFLFLRFLLVCILLLPYTVIELSKIKVAITDYWKIILLGLFSQSALILLVLGLEYTTAVDAAIIGAAGVLLSMAAGHYFFNEKMHPGIKLGVVIALFGTAIVILEPLLNNVLVSETPVMMRIWGNLLVFIYHIFFLLYIIWSKISMGKTNKIIKKTLHFIHIKPLKHPYPSTLLAAISFYVGMFSMLPFALAENLGSLGSYTYDLSALDIRAVIGLLYMALFSSIMAYFMFEWALNKVSVVDTAILGYLSTIFGIPFAFIILGEIPSRFGLVGAGVITAGVVLAEVSAHFHKKKRGLFKFL